MDNVGDVVMGVGPCYCCSWYARPLCQVAKLVITEAAIIAELAVYEKLNGNLRFYFQAYREGCSSQPKFNTVC